MEKFQNKTVKELLNRCETIWALENLGGLAEWDGEVYMPEGGSGDRGFALAKVEGLKQKLILDKEFLALFEKARNEQGLTEHEQGVLRILGDDIKVFKKLPPAFVEKFEETASTSQVVWRNARSKDDFSAFAPNLQKIVDLCREKADHLGYQDHPYDALLDLYEEGWTKKDFEAYFGQIREPLKNLLAEIKRSSRYAERHPLEQEAYDRGAAEKLNEHVLTALRANRERLRLDVSTHPFTQNMSANDVRITTRYEGKNVKDTLMSVIHEFGHALYELSLDQELNRTPLAGGVSYGVHESQSRFWENIVGRSPEFLASVYAKAKELMPFVQKYLLDDFVFYFNTVKPGLIRVEADEVTYHFHIMLRFEIESRLLEGSLAVPELPEFWNAKVEEYLGVRPKTNREGVLQDIHWSGGSIGYFPTYSLGTVMTGIWKEGIEKDLGSIGEALDIGRTSVPGTALVPGTSSVCADGIEKIQTWLKDKIHRHGSTYTPKQLIEKASGKPFSAEPFLKYVREKYRKVYKI